jgi:hypothetical protein
MPSITMAARDTLVDRFHALTSAGRLSVVVPGGVREEIQHPNTPAGVKMQPCHASSTYNQD